MKKCNKFYCTACPFIEECQSVNANKFTWNISENVNCETYNIVYMIHCDKDNCKQKYIGESFRTLKERLSEHRGYINNRKLKTATGFHFNQPGHSISNLKISIIENVTGFAVHKIIDMQLSLFLFRYWIRPFYW